MPTENKKCTGRVKWFDNAKGFGFIIGPQPIDVMVHYSDIIMDGFRRLTEGDTVEYEAEFNSATGWRGKKVTLVSSSLETPATSQ